MGPYSKQDGARKGAVDARPADAPALAAIGLEAEFGLVVDGAPIEVEEIFRDPRDFMGDALIHRVGTSYHLPTGGAVYFDTGVIEVATPLIEIEHARGPLAVGIDPPGQRRARGLGKAQRPSRGLDRVQHPLQRVVRASGRSAR